MFELPAAGGIRRVSVTKAWIAKMEREGRLSLANNTFIQAHVLDPAGAARKSLGLPGPEAPFIVETWAIGNDISQAQVDEFIDSETHAVYVLRAYFEGNPQTVILARDKWEKTKVQLGL